MVSEREIERDKERGDWKLVWQDEFDGTAVDQMKWTLVKGDGTDFGLPPGWGNNELQIYTDQRENVRVENGHLVLEARRTDRELSSGRIRSKHRGDWKYAKVEVRAKLPEGKGLWPAIWMMPTDERYGTWAASGEIDIMELKGQKPDQIWGSLHYGKAWPGNKHSGETYRLPAGQSFTDDFHSYAIEWEPDFIRWCVDGQPWQTQRKWHTAGAPFPAPFDQSFHLILNLAVGGEFVGKPSRTTPFPAQMLVDYVRVYQRKWNRQYKNKTIANAAMQTE